MKLSLSILTYGFVIFASIGIKLNQALQNEVKIVVKLKQTDDRGNRSLNFVHNSSSNQEPSKGKDSIGTPSTTQVNNNKLDSVSSISHPQFYFSKDNQNHPTTSHYPSNFNLNTIAPGMTRIIPHRIIHPNNNILATKPTAMQEQPKPSLRSPIAPNQFISHVSSFSDLRTGIYGPVSFSGPFFVSSELIPGQIRESEYNNYFNNFIGSFNSKTNTQEPDSRDNNNNEYYSSVLRPPMPIKLFHKNYNQNSFKTQFQSNIQPINQFLLPVTPSSSSKSEYFSIIKKPHDHRQPI